MYIPWKYRKPSIVERDSCNIIGRFSEANKDDLIKSVNDMVLTWLQKDDVLERSPCQITFDGENGSEATIMFHAHEINIWTCANCWMVWRIASSESWPHIISHKVRSLGDNACATKYLKNEVKSECFYNRENPWKRAFYHFFRKITDWLRD